MNILSQNLIGSYNDEIPAFHLTVEDLDVHTKLRAARTYFMTKNVRRDKDVESILNDENVTMEY